MSRRRDDIEKPWDHELMATFNILPDVKVVNGKFEVFWEGLEVTEDGHWHLEGKTREEVWQIIFGPLPTRKKTKVWYVVTECDDPTCLSPYHLYLGRIVDLAYEIRRKLARQGGKMKADDWAMIRKLSATETTAQIGRIYNIPAKEIRRRLRVKRPSGQRTRAGRQARKSSTQQAHRTERSEDQH